MKNWKTTLAGALTVAIVAAKIFWPNIITAEVAAEATTLMVSLGLIAAKDSNVTGV